MLLHMIYQKWSSSIEAVAFLEYFLVEDESPLCLERRIVDHI